MMIPLQWFADGGHLSLQSIWACMNAWVKKVPVFVKIQEGRRYMARGRRERLLSGRPPSFWQSLALRGNLLKRGTAR